MMTIIIILTFIVLYAAWMITEMVRKRRRRRVQQGRCLHCGYILHGIKGVICPECGKNTQPENPGNQRKLAPLKKDTGPYVPPTP